MIEVRIYHVDDAAIADEVEIGRVRIERVETYSDKTADYAINFAVERMRAVGLHTRVIRAFPRLKYNVLGLLVQALSTLEEGELSLEPKVSSRDMARPVRGIGSAFS